MNERDIFIAALKINDDAQRVAYLDEACAGDVGLKRRVEALLGALNDAGSYLEQPALDPVATLDQPITDQPITGMGGLPVFHAAAKKLGLEELFYRASDHQAQEAWILRIRVVDGDHPHPAGGRGES